MTAMSTITDAARRLVEAAVAADGRRPARAATCAELECATQSFADMKVPLPAGLLEVYKVTLGIPGFHYDDDMIHAPFVLPREIARVYGLPTIRNQVMRHPMLEIGRCLRVGLVMDMDGMFSLQPYYPDDPPTEFPFTFEEAFPAYVEAAIAEIAEFDDETGA
jgi:hypothetical protein